MGWSRSFWVQGASSVAVDSSGKKFLLVSLNSSKFFRVVDATAFVILFFFFSSLTTDMNPSTKRPRVPAGQPGKVYNAPGVSVYYFFLVFGWLLIPFHRPVYDSHEGRKPMANVGVHSDIGIIIRGRFILKQKFCISMWFCSKNSILFSHANLMMLLGEHRRLLLLYSMAPLLSSSQAVCFGSRGNGRNVTADSLRIFAIKS